MKAARFGLQDDQGETGQARPGLCSSALIEVGMSRHFKFEFG